MLTIHGPASRKRLCNGVTRRDALRIGALAMGGAASLTLPQLLAAEGRSGRRSHKSVIMIYLCGGPPHQDMYDLKIDAPIEVRGEFDPIATNVPGIEICELLPKLAKIMDKLVPIRSVVGCRDDHAGYQCFTGHLSQNEPAGGWPHLGSVVSRLPGPTTPGVPPFVSLCYVTQHKPYNEPGPGFLGLGHSAFRPMGEGRDDLVLQGITADRLDDRRGLLSSVDRMRRDMGRPAARWTAWMSSRNGRWAFSRRASCSTPSTSRKSPKRSASVTAITTRAARRGTALRVCRRICSWRGGWSKRACASSRSTTASGIGTGRISRTPRKSCRFSIRRCRPSSKICTSAASTDDVTVIAWGEFGRTPKINKDAGRDHWPRVSCALMAGGGMRTGQAIGATDRLGGEATERPVTFEEVHATLYHNLGINFDASPRLFDFRGRPQNIVAPEVKAIRELV